MEERQKGKEEPFVRYAFPFFLFPFFPPHTEAAATSLSLDFAQPISSFDIYVPSLFDRVFFPCPIATMVYGLDVDQC
jgi:hypothetical protein